MYLLTNETLRQQLINIFVAIPAETLVKKFGPMVVYNNKVKWLTKLLAVCSCLLAEPMLQAQNEYASFQHFSVKDGLPSDQVYNCSQDAQGFLWISTDAGVSRFDGRAFVNFSVADGLGDNEIHEQVVDHSDRVWFIPFSGKLSYYKHGRIYQEDLDDFENAAGAGFSGHLMMTEDRKANIYLSKAGSKKIIRLGFDGRKFVFDLERLMSPDEYLIAFFGNAQGELFCVTSRQRLLRLQQNGAMDITPPAFLKSEKPLQFFVSHDASLGYVLFSGAEGLYRLTEMGAERIMSSEKLGGLNMQEFMQVYFDGHGNLWLSHLRGNTLVFRNNGRGGFDEKMSLLKNQFAIVSYDGEGNIWFSTNKGLYSTTYSQIQDRETFDINRCLLVQKVISCAIDRDSGLWLGYSNGFVSRHCAGAVKTYDLNVDRRTNNRVMRISINKDGNVLAGTDESLMLIKRRARNNYDAPRRFLDQAGNPLHCPVKDIFYNKEGDVFLSTATSNLKLDVSAGVPIARTFSNTYFSRRIRHFCSFYDNSNNLYISSIEGLEVIEKGTATNLSERDDRLKTRVQDFVQASDSTIFIAAYNNGLIAIKNGRYVAGLPMFEGKNVICKRIFIKNDTIYVASNRGLGVAIYRQNKFRLLKLLSIRDGLGSCDVNDICFSGDKIYVATSNGVSCLKAGMLEQGRMLPPKLLLQNVRVDDSLYPARNEYTLSYETHLVRLNFIAPVLGNPELLEYRYRYNPSEKWNETPANFIEFSKLKPGRYNIEFQAKKHNSNWSPSSRIMVIIKPPFYGTWWFYTLMFIASAAFLFFTTRYWMNRKLRNQLYALKQKEAIEKERNRIAADIHDDIGSELTNIAIMSQVLKYKSGLSMHEDSLKVAEKIQASSYNIITKMNEVIWTLNNTTDTLLDFASYIRSYVTEIGENTGINLDVEIDKSTSVGLRMPAEKRRSIFMVVKEMLQNALKHSKACEVKLTLSLQRRGILHIKYEDNGVGFDTSAMNTGNGLSNIKKRVAESSGIVDINSSPGNGCRIRIYFPLQPS